MGTIKGTLILLFLSLGALCANASVRYMTIERKSGDKISFLLAENPEITFDENNHLVVNGNTETSFVLSNVKNYHFTENDETSTSNVGNATLNGLRIISLDNQTIRIENAPAAAPIKIVGMNGITWVDTSADNAGGATISLPQQKGVYVLSVGNQSIRVIRK